MWDIQFLVFARRCVVRAEEANTSATVVLSKVKFEELKAAGAAMCLKTRHAQVPILPTNLHSCCHWG